MLLFTYSLIGLRVDGVEINREGYRLFAQSIELDRLQKKLIIGAVAD